MSKKQPFAELAGKSIEELAQLEAETAQWAREMLANSPTALRFLKAVLPEPSSLGENYTGKTNIGCVIRGLKDGLGGDKLLVSNMPMEPATKPAVPWLANCQLP